MKANKKTLLAFRQMMENEQEYYDYEGLIEQCIEETKLLKAEGIPLLSYDECGVEWCDEPICTLNELIDNFARIFMDKILNMAESMIGEDISCYFDDED